MHLKNKIFVLLPDGVGIRNFVFSSFNVLGKKKGLDVIYWNNTALNLNDLGCNELKITQAKLHKFTEILKSAKIQIELSQFIKKTKNPIFNKYRFPLKPKNWKDMLKKIGIQSVIWLFNSEQGLVRVKKMIHFLETSTPFFKQCLEVLKKEQPAFVFCTNQRPSLAIAPILAAKKLGIKTGTFIFSWDNLPKATMVIETDYYFVWSEHMKNELLFYYPHLQAHQIKITGTPQFEPHFNQSLYQNKQAFFKQHQLDESKQYICFSGDDVTTSPNDHYYLEDVAKAIKKLNAKGYNLGLIYRKCPVDFTNRYVPIFEKYKEIITLIHPLWENYGNSWNAVMPSQHDIALLVNTVKFSEVVINVGSSMVFDFVAHNKPCAFLNYNTTKTENAEWNIETIYKFIHFESMPSNDAVLWINRENQIEDVIISALQQPNLQATQQWFQKICGKTPTQASEHIWNEINALVQ